MSERLSRTWLGWIIAVSIAHDLSPSQQRAEAAARLLTFEVVADAGILRQPRDGRVLVVLSRNADVEPRLGAGDVGADAPWVTGRDAPGLRAGTVVVLDGDSAAFPSALSEIPPGEYFAQAVFDSNIDLRTINAPGNLYSDVKRVTIGGQPKPGNGNNTVSRLRLSHAVPAEQLPHDTTELKFVKITSELLSAFHGRPMYLRAGVILPRGYEREPQRRYPLRVRIGGYGTPFTDVQDLMKPGAEFRTAWLSDAAPRMILLHLDGDGPFGDSYQVNSANNGPYGDAITKELIPYVETTFRAIGTSASRAVDGGSTGGWVSLALQIFYPDFFNGAWASCPDGVDLRAFQLLNIYSDENAYVNEHGFDRPSARDTDGDVRFTMRHEARMENALGAGDNWTMSGEQWGAWNATYGPRGADGRPRALWDPRTGQIDRAVVDHWKSYDLRLVLERNWKTLAPKLDGRLNIWVGEADTYFLNNAVHLLDEFVSKAQPRIRVRIVYGPGQRHCWSGLDEAETMREIGAQTGARP